jgi:pyruvate/2-oxoglutarate dehydrogenase complex dihydrolipoamide acyltransferase (E2) component
VQKHNAIFPEQQLTWVGITAPDPYDLRLSQAYQAIKVSKEYFQWRKEECKERPLGIGHKRKAAPAGEKKAKRQHTQDLEEQRKRALLRAFIEASVAYLQSPSHSLQAKAEAKAQAEAKAKQAQAEASAKAKQEEEAKAKAKQAEEEKAKQRAREERLREQQAQRVRELQTQQAEEERERMEDQKHLKALEPDIKFLASLAGSRAVILCPTLFLKQVYHLHPPPRPLPPIQSGADRKDLLNAIRTYHVDKNTKCANRHRIMCSEITKILNGLLESHC